MEGSLALSTSLIKSNSTLILLSFNAIHTKVLNMFKIASAFLLFLPLVAATGTIVCTNEIVDFSVVDPSVTPAIVTDLTSVVDLDDFPTCKLNIEAITTSYPGNCDEGTLKCVKFFLDDVEVHREKFAPFLLYSDRNGTICSEKPPLGKTKVKACTYTDKRCEVGMQGCKEVEVDFKDCDGIEPPVTAPVKPPVLAPVEPPVDVCTDNNEVLSFELVDASSPRKPIVTPFTPPIIDLLDFPNCELNIFAVAKNNTCGAPPIKCVRLSLGSQDKSEEFVPYALYGDRLIYGGGVRDGKPELGANTLKACTYTDSNCQTGEQGCLEVDVFVKDCIPMSM
jgi:hypothetical protein